MSAAAALASFAGLPASAQGTDDIGSLEEVVVTAERREQNIQKMSLSITALAGDDLQAEGKTRLEDALATVPAVRIQENALTGGTPFIRGVGPALGTDPSAAISLDGVYQSEGLFGSQFDIARVEVLKGPQGTLYGRNATAGSVNIVSNDPTSEFGGSGSAQIGSYNMLRVEGMLNVPLSERTAIRAAFLSADHDGYYSNNTMDENLRAGRLKFKFTGDNLQLLLAADTVKLGGHGPGSTQAPIAAHADDPWRTRSQTGQQQSTRKSLYGQLDWDLGFGTLTYQPAWYEVQIYGDFNLLDSMGLIVSNQRNRQTTHELRLASSADQKLQWILGGYLLNNKGKANPVALQLAAGTHGAPSSSSPTPTETDSKAVFGQLTAPVGDKLRLIAGGRYTWDEKSAARTCFQPLTVCPAPPGPPTPSFPGANITGRSPTVSIETNKFTYKVGVEYDLAPENMLYATYSTGFKAGGINDPTASFSNPSAYATYQPEELKSFELGSKNRFLDNRLQLNVAAFHYDYTNYQVFTVSFGTNPPIVSVLNAAAATLQGVELDSSFQITPRTRFNAGVAYNDNTFDSFIYFSDAYPPSVGGLNRSGSRLPQAPVWTEVIGLDHDFSLAGGTLTLGGEARFYSESDTTIEPALDAHQPSYSMLDFHAVYQPEGANWSVNAFLNNAGDEVVRQFTREINPANIHELTIGAPRTYGIGVSAKF